MRGLVLALALLAATPAFAQVTSRPTDPPIVTAETESWYRQAQPLQFAGDLYYPAGARVFFNGNTMVRTGHYNGVPIYADTTLEPYSVVFIPISRGVMQPYERPRHGDLAGTTGSRTPSFPVGYAHEGTTIPGAAVSPTNLPLPIDAIGPYTPGAAAAPQTGAARGGAADTQPILTLLRPENNDGIWVQYGGFKWISAGSAVPLRAADFRLIGEYAGFPVFARQNVTENVIYIPTRAGLVAPYRQKQ